jgi:ERCC4-type nuclease
MMQMFKNNFTQYQLDTHVLANIVILVDTRENANQHILDYFNKKEIKYISQKLEYGDYAIMLKKNEKYNIHADLVLDYAVERKGSLEEISGNFTNDRTRIEQEFWRGNNKIAVVIENGSIDNVIKGNYNTKYNKTSFLATLFTFMARYGINYTFTEKSNAGAIIFAILYYKLREEIK